VRKLIRREAVTLELEEKGTGVFMKDTSKVMKRRCTPRVRSLSAFFSPYTPPERNSYAKIIYITR
jgi:hypothetical protein